MYSLPWEFLDDETLDEIGNTLNHFLEASEATKQDRYISYA